MRLALIRGATAGCVGALALAVVLVAVEPRTVAQRRTDASLDRSGVVVVAEATSGNEGGAFSDPAETLGLAGLAVLYGVVAGAVLAALSTRVGSVPLVAVGLAAVAVAVLALADRFTGRDVGAQLAFWVVAAGWLWWAGRDVSRRAASPRRP